MFYFYYLLLFVIVEKMGTGRTFLEVAQKAVCSGTTHLEQFYQDVVDKGGEGVILRDPLEFLQSGRSPGYLKHKVIGNLSRSLALLCLCCIVLCCC